MKQKTVFYCTECGNETMKWNGRCSACGAWNTIVEQPRQIERPGAAVGKTVRRGTAAARPMAEVESSEEIRLSTGLGELDRVLGGGAVIGSLVLVGGAPGIGKSTLMLQICDHLPATVLYVSGEESERQLKLRADRLGIAQDKLYVLSATGMEDILDAAEELKPEVLIVDSIQTTYDASLTSPPGSVGQVRACTAELMELAKGSGVTVFVVGHVTKEGAIAGPRILEHMVDCVLYFEGDQHMLYRILRAVKNRFGATNEIGVFAMEERGLTEVPNPSQALLSARPANTPGTCVTCVMEGARPILAEIQALLAPTSFSAPRRMSNGVDYNRVVMLLADADEPAFSDMLAQEHTKGGRRLRRGPVFRSQPCHRQLRRLSERRGRPDAGRAQRGPGHSAGAGVQLSGPAAAAGPGRHRRGGPHRRTAGRQHAGPAHFGGAPPELSPLYRAQLGQRDRGGAGRSAADPRPKHPGSHRRGPAAGILTEGRIGTL